MNGPTAVRVNPDSASEPWSIGAVRPETSDRAVEAFAVAYGLSPREVRCLTAAEPDGSLCALAFERLRLQQIA
ncbi:hypothetical protein FPZ24_04365 [Sphingomonas panacisoli]|uniref:Uncharacterized protein n=1 Tax=Sphingomonas panacisoli TaxID=1813879 RepID=A0A5B8LGA6_9SPHN|nr:hypothetical protein [Sphingomonas panacisoli]QDZ06805.1 hypothetical protein FPZ24_04365 [Sphingomonas panacisoli]